MPPRPRTASSRYPATWSPSLTPVVSKEQPFVSFATQACNRRSDRRLAALRAADSVAFMADELSRSSRSRGPAPMPAGTVTFMFTDIEGSTSLLRRLREEYARLLVDHSRLLAAAVDSHGGRVVDTQGDALFAVFHVPERRSPPPRRRSAAWPPTRGREAS